jgi:hypothetical protein
MQLLELSNGGFALVDDDDFARLSQWKWTRTHAGYAVRKVKVDGKRKQVWMHRDVAKTPDGKVTDHINGNRLDNRKENLRVCTTSQNKMNGNSYRGSYSQFKGVTYRKDKPDHPWQARVRVEGTCIHLGFFGTEAAAAAAYNSGALKHHGEYARLNDLQ